MQLQVSMTVAISTLYLTSSRVRSADRRSFQLASFICKQVVPVLFKPQVGFRGDWWPNKTLCSVDHYDFLLVSFSNYSIDYCIHTIHAFNATVDVDLVGISPQHSALKT